MNYALIIAGGSGNRMGQDIPKQFMHVDNCPIIIHTMMAFQKHPDIQGIAVVCLAGWETVLQSYANQFCITKLKWIFPGGSNGQESIHNGIYGLKEVGCGDDDLVLVHDAVRPLLSQDIISSNIAICQKYGYAITGIVCCRIAVPGCGKGYTAIHALCGSHDGSYLFHDSQPAEHLSPAAGSSAGFSHHLLLYHEAAEGADIRRVYSFL